MSKPAYKLILTNRTEKVGVKIMVRLFFIFYIFVQLYLFGDALNNKTIADIGKKKENWNVDIIRRSKAQDLRIYVLDVGQGDSIFIEFPYGETMLIDAGSMDGKKYCEHIMNFLNNYFDENKYKEKTIDVVVATHPHEDHINFLEDIIGEEENFNINWYIDNGQSNKTKTYKNLMKAITKLDKDDKLDYIDVKEDYFPCGIYDFEKEIVDFEGVDIYVLGSFNSKDKEDFNNSSLVLKIIYGETYILLMGDAEAEEEKRILERVKRKEKEVDVDVLKVGHHGSETSTSKCFISKVSPEVSIISVGNYLKSKGAKRHGHPRKETIERLIEYTKGERKTYKIDAYDSNSKSKGWKGMKINKGIYLTSIDGDVVVKLDDNKNIKVEKLELNGLNRN